MTTQITDTTARTIATLAIRIDTLDQELHTYELNGATKAARPVRAQLDQARAQLADSIAAATGGAR